MTTTAALARPGSWPRPVHRRLGLALTVAGPSRNRAGGMLTELTSSRWVLFVNVPIGLVVLLLAPPGLVNEPGNPGHFDRPGALSATAGLALLVYGLTHAAAGGWCNDVIEARSPHALVPLHIFTNRNRSASYAMMLCIGAALFGSLGLAVLVTVATSVARRRMDAPTSAARRGALIPAVLARAVTHRYTSAVDVAAGLGALALVAALAAIQVNRAELPLAPAR